nr:hypothetical protein [Tanacetum cinerariifolium]
TKEYQQAEFLPVPASVLEKRVGELCGRPVRALNPWDNERFFHLRIIRPGKADNNPLHRDVWIPDYHNCLNIYVPVAGSTAQSSLTLVRTTKPTLQLGATNFSGRAGFLAEFRALFFPALMAAADCLTLPYAATGAFSGLLTDYIAASPALAPFYNRRPDLAAFQAQIEEKQAAYSPEARQRLVADLRAQYADLGGEAPPAVAANLDLLAKETTFTITTGHQLNLFTGPLYFVYKIVTAIKLSQQLKAEYPQYDFVPVYWLATEDHDFAEINHFQLFGKTLSWAGPGEGHLGGPV